MPAPAKTGKETKPPGNLHRRQLFYWMGRSLDQENKGRKVFRDAVIEQLFTQLRGSLERGIWVKRPRVPEHLDYRGKTFALHEPIACFTEWSLGESLPHTAEYGRVGFGFPKRWVIERDGQSVTYFRHNAKGSFLPAAFRLLGALGERRADGTWTAKPGAGGFADLRYLLHFAKMIRLKHPASEEKPRAPAPQVRRLRATRKRSAAAIDTQTYQRRFGRPLQFVEEREWRIVYHESNKRFVPGGGAAKNEPDHYLPYVPGDELFTLVLPDNKVMSRILEHDWFTERLFTPWKCYPQLEGRRVPPVTLLAHSDIGTF